MAITIRSITAGSNDGTTATVSATTPTGATQAQVGDVLLIIHGNDFYALSNMPTPTVSPGSPTVTAVTNGTADAGVNLAHLKSYTAVVATGGAQTVSVTETGTHDEEKSLYVLVLAGADTTTPVDIAANTSGGSATSQPAPSVSPTSSDALLVCVSHSGGGSATASYTAPGSMSNKTEIHVGGLSAALATEQLAASGATGTRTFTAANAIPWAAVSVAVKTAAVAATATASAPLTVAGGLRPGPAGTSLILGSVAASRDFQQPVDVIGAPPRAPGGIGSAIVISSRAPSRDAQPTTLVAGTAPRPPATGSALVLASRSIPPPAVDTPPPASVVPARYRPYPSPTAVVLGSVAPSRDAQPAPVVAAASPVRVAGSAWAVTSRADPAATVDTAPRPTVVGTQRPSGPGSGLVVSSTAPSLDAQPTPVQTAAASVQVRRGGALVLGSAADPVAVAPPPAVLSTTIILARPGSAAVPRTTADPPPPTLPLAVLAPAALLPRRPGAAALSRAPVPPFVAPPGTPTAPLVVMPATVWRIVRAPLVYSGVPCPCITPRPSTGTVGRPNTGTVVYDLTALTRPSTGVVTRPDTGIVKDPCC